MAGGGVRPGITYGETDDYSYNVVKDPVHVRDFNATILHCLGIDHNKFTYKFQGLDQKLTSPVPASCRAGIAGVIAAHKLAGAVRSLRIRTLRAQWLCTLGVSAILLILPFAVRLDGQPHADWLQFFGRFHPLLVHLPIGLIVLLPFLEFAGTTRPALAGSCRLRPAT